MPPRWGGRTVPGQCFLKAVVGARKLFGRPLWSMRKLYWPCLFEDLGGSLVFYTSSWFMVEMNHLYNKQKICAKKRSYLCFFTICVCFWEFIVCHSRTPRTGASQKKVMNIQRKTRRSNSKNTRDGRVCRCSLACSPRFSWVIMGHPLSSWWCMQYILVGPWWIRSILM